MFKKILFLVCTSVGITSFAQTNAQQVDSRLLGKYSVIELQKMQTAQPEQYQFLLNALNKGVYIAEIPQQKAKDIVWDGELNIDPAKTHTFITLNKEITENYQYYKITGTTKMLIILPKAILTSKNFNK